MTLCPFWRYSVSPTTSPGSTLKWRLSPSPIISAANTLSSTSAFIFFPWLLSPQPSSTTSASKDSIPRPPSSNTILSLSILQVRNELREIKMQKAEGPSGISSKLLRCRADQLFGIMFNMSLKLGKAPQLWKTSYMVPVPKTTHPEDLSSHRLVALTSRLIKTLKRLVLKHICLLLQSSLDLV